METHKGGTADHHSSAGFAVRDDALANCAKDAGRIAAELRTLAREDLRTVRGLPEDAFGPLARTTGFTSALTRLSGRIGSATEALAADLSEIESNVDSTRHDYRATERMITSRLTEVLA